MGFIELPYLLDAAFKIGFDRVSHAIGIEFHGRNGISRFHDASKGYRGLWCSPTHIASQDFSDGGCGFEDFSFFL